MPSKEVIPLQKLPASGEISSEVKQPVSVKDQPKSDTLSGSDDRLGTHPQSQSGTTAMPGKLGRYQLVKEIGRGGMGVVYLAEDTVLKRKVALKLPQFESHNQDQMQARFIREAQMAAQLSHVNICQVYDVDVIDGRYVMAMEYIEGKTLATFMKSGKSLSDRQAALLIRKVAQAVELAHQRGLIHRDLKPGNIMLPAPDPVRKVIEPKVMDFGLAKSLASKGTELTKSGMIVGTPCYMSKEQWSGKDSTLGPSCDVYSLGIIFYELLTGKLPYKVDPEEPPTSWFVQMVTQPQIKPAEHKPGIDPSLEAIVLKAIATEPQDRYATMAEFASELDAWLKGKPVQGQTQLGIDLGFLPAISTAKSAARKPQRKRSWIPAAATLGFTALLITTCLALFTKNFRVSPFLFTETRQTDTAKAEFTPSVTASDSGSTVYGLRNGDFSEGLEGWELEGGATMFRVFSFPSGEPGLTTGSEGGIAPITGRAFQIFRVPPDAEELVFFVHGGANPNLYVALRDSERELYRQGAFNDNAPFKVHWNISKWRGKKLILEIVDLQTGHWSHIGVHGFKLTQSGSSITEP